MRFTRQELYALVWEKSTVQLAREFGISDRGLAKICARHIIPRPTVGYWRLVEVDRQPKRPKLPPIKDGALETVDITPVRRNDPEVFFHSDVRGSREALELITRELRERAAIREYVHLINVAGAWIRPADVERTIVILTRIVSSLEASSETFAITKDAFVIRRNSDELSFRLSSHAEATFSFHLTPIEGFKWARPNWAENERVQFEDMLSHIMYACSQLLFRLEDRRIVPAGIAAREQHWRFESMRARREEDRMRFVKDLVGKHAEAVKWRIWIADARTLIDDQNTHFERMIAWAASNLMRLEAEIDVQKIEKLCSDRMLFPSQQEDPLGSA